MLDSKELSKVKRRTAHYTYFSCQVKGFAGQRQINARTQWTPASFVFKRFIHVLSQRECPRQRVVKALAADQLLAFPGFLAVLDLCR